MRPTVDFVIPAYKRNSLAEAIESVYSQIEHAAAWDQCSLRITDDCSPGADRVRFLEELRLRFPKARVERLSENVGMSKNLLTLLKSSIADFVFILTDDDCFLRDSLPKVLALIDHATLNSCNVIVCPRMTYTDTGEYVTTEPRLFTRHEIIPASSHVAIRLAHMAHILSGLIVRRDEVDFEFWAEHAENAYFPIIFVGSAVRNSAALYSRLPLVRHTVNNEVFWGRWGSSIVAIESRLYRDFHAALDLVMMASVSPRRGTSNALHRAVIPDLFLLKQSARLEVSRALNRAPKTNFSDTANTLRLRLLRKLIHDIISAFRIPIRWAHFAVRQILKTKVMFHSFLTN